MKIKKKCQGLLVLLLSLSLLCACGSNTRIDDYATNKGYEQSSVTENTEKGIPKEEIKVGVLHISDPAAETAATEELLAMDCDVMSQHCDTPYPQTLAQEKGVYGIGYNSDMSKETPDSCLCSVIWNWSAYYTTAVQSVIEGTWDGSNYYGGMAEGLVDITELADFCVGGTQEKVDEATAQILSGSFNVFDGVIETNDGSTVGEEGKTLDDATITGGINWYYKNVVVLD